jgi:hypothetical protein
MAPLHFNRGNNSSTFDSDVHWVMSYPSSKARERADTSSVATAHGLHNAVYSHPGVVAQAGEDNSRTGMVT